MRHRSQQLITALVAVILGILIVGCAPKIVSVPVACVEQASIPPETLQPRLTGNAPADVMILLDTTLGLRNETGLLRALLRGCTSP